MSHLPKSVLITGCSEGGIGAALASAFHTKGYHVFATARNTAKIPDTLSSSPGVTLLSLDVLSAQSIASAVASVDAHTNGTLDVLVNNSGEPMIMPLLDSPIKEGKKLFEVNFWGPVAMVQAFAPLLIKAGGCVVNNSSATARAPMPLLGIYSGSKAALAATSEACRLELQPLGVRTITLITSGVRTSSPGKYAGPELPPSSPYFPIQGLLERLRVGSLQKRAMSSTQYASTVVGHVEKGASGEIWAGQDALMIRIATWMSPQATADMIIESLVPISKEMAQAEKKMADSMS